MRIQNKRTVRFPTLGLGAGDGQRHVFVMFIMAPLLILLVTAGTQNTTTFESGTISFESIDGVMITADLYAGHEKTAPFILLFHRAGWSRGEYIEIAPKLNKMGFNCMAIDQRSGEQVNDVINETHLQAEKLRKDVAYVDALPDLEAALLFVRSSNWNPDKIIIWGSSYSASLAFIVGQKHPGDIHGLIAFSPGEYFLFEDKEIKDYAGEVTCPVFITSTKTEHAKWETIYDAVPSTKKTSFLPEADGKHGSEALWEKNLGYEEYWTALTPFLRNFLNRDLASPPSRKIHKR